MGYKMAFIVLLAVAIATVTCKTSSLWENDDIANEIEQFANYQQPTIVSEAYVLQVIQDRIDNRLGGTILYDGLYVSAVRLTYIYITYITGTVLKQGGRKCFFVFFCEISTK